MHVCKCRIHCIRTRQAAYRLASTLEGLGLDVNLEFVAGAGHSDSEPGLVDAMVRATDSLAKELGQQ